MVGCAPQNPRHSSPVSAPFRAHADDVGMLPATGLSLAERDRVADALEAPWGIRQVRRLREVFVPDQVTPGAMTRRIDEIVREPSSCHGRHPSRSIPSRITEVSLVVWMGVMKADA